MAPTPSTEPGLSSGDRVELLRIARRSIESGLDGTAVRIRAERFSASLQAIRASFVTLEVEGRLRGCIGTLEARRPLVEDVAHNAYSAAFDDPRFPPVRRLELAAIEIHLSLLSLPEPMTFRSEQDLLAQLQPNVHGLVLEEGRRRGTFLPSVWEQLPDPVEFLRHLKHKAGLPADYWSPTLRVSRYTAESIP